MKRYTQKALRKLVADGLAIDVTSARNRNEIPERYTQVGYALGIYGTNGKLLEGESGQLYAVTKATSSLYMF
jgi:hypothetical protein